MVALLLFAFVIFVVYLVGTCAEFGIPISISNTFYCWQSTNEKPSDRNELMFCGAMTLSGLTLIPAWLYVSNEYTQFLAFLSVAGMLFVGGASAYKETLTKAVHYTSAGIWATGAIAWTLISSEYIALVIGLGSALIGHAIDNFKNRTFWLEVSVVITMFLAILNKYIDLL